MNIQTYTDRLRDAALQDSFKLSHYGKLGEVDLPVLERCGIKEASNVYISAGVHGNEPAGPMALLKMLENHSLPETVNLTLFPLINPTGLLAGTRENADGIDLNRDYGIEPRSYETRAQLEWIGVRLFDLALCLHEDDDGEGFYLYSHVPPTTTQDYPGLAIAAAEPFTGIDKRSFIDEMPAKDGRMFPPESVIKSFGNNLPEALRLHNQHSAAFTFTTETPSQQPMINRIRAQEAVVCTLLNTFLNEK